MNKPTFVLQDREILMRAETLCVSDNPEEIIRAARGSRSSSFAIGVQGEDEPLENRSGVDALQTYMDMKLGRDTPAVRQRRRTDMLLCG